MSKFFDAALPRTLLSILGALIVSTGFVAAAVGPAHAAPVAIARAA